MQKTFIIALITVLTAARIFAQPDSFAQFASANPGYFNVGVGTSVMVGDAKSFNGVVPVESGTQNAAIKLIGDTSVNLEGGYRFSRVPLRMGFSFISMLSTVSSNVETYAKSEDQLNILSYAVDTLYDYAITPHWILSAGGALGFTSFVYSGGSSVVNTGPAPTYNRVGFSYQAIAELMYRFSGITLGVTDHFIGTTVRANSIYPSADNKHYLLGNYIGCTVGVMFW